MSIKTHNFNFIDDLPKTLDLDLAGVSLGYLLDYLESEYSSEIKRAILDGGKLTDAARVSINGVSAYDLNAVIPDNSQLVFAYVLAGG